MDNRTCSVAGCESLAKARGWCSKHYQRWRSLGSVFAVQETGACVGCGVVVCKGKSGPVPERCNECRDHYRKRVQAKKHRETAKRRARELTQRRLAVTHKICPQCEIEFTPERDVRQKFCSKRCNRAFYRDRSSKSCEAVGCVRPVRARGMCSMHYRRWRRAEGLEKAEPWSEERYQHWKKRQDQKRANQVQPIRNVDVFERDKWICGICGEPVGRSLEWPDPLCATLGHILPLSKGGHHVWENVRLVHARCNSGRGDQISA